MEWRRISCLATIVVLAVLTFVGDRLPAQIISNASDKRLAFSRAAKLSRTINIGRWFGRDMPATDLHYQDYISDAEARRIHEWGFSAVRLPVREPFLFVRSRLDAHLNSRRLDFLDAAIRRLNNAGLVVIVDFHSKERAKQEADQSYRERIIHFWSLLAAHLAHSDPTRVYLELLNEPRFINDPFAWNDFQLKLFASVRKAAPRHTIIATSTKYSDPQTFRYLEPLPDGNVIYTFHTYDPVAFTHQGADFLKPKLREVRGLPWPPYSTCEKIAENYPADSVAISYINEYCKSGWGDQKFAEYLRPAFEWAKRFDSPVFVGEFGVRSVAAAEVDRLRWLSMARTFFERNHVSWGLWSYDDCYGLSLKVQGSCPAGTDGKADLEASWERACRTLAALQMTPADCRKARPRDIVAR